LEPWDILVKVSHVSCCMWCSSDYCDDSMCMEWWLCACNTREGNIAYVMFTSYLGVPYKSRVDHIISNLCDHKVGWKDC